MSKYGLGKGLGALIPNGAPPSDPMGVTDSFSAQPGVSPIEDNSLPSSVSIPEPDLSVPEIENKSIVETQSDIDPLVEQALKEAPVDMSQVLKVNPDNIVPNPHQPRKVFDPHSLQELGDSIAKHGIIQPLVVTKLPNGTYELIAGERRLQASKLIGLKEVPVIVRHDEIKDGDKLELAIIENIQRKDLNIIEQARAFKRLHEEFDIPMTAIADRLGKSRPVISNVIRLLDLPVEVQRALMEGKLAEGHGRAILQVADREKQYALFNLILEKHLTTDQAFALAKEWTARPYLRKNIRQKTPELKAMESLLQNKLNVRRVEITTSDNGGGHIQLYFLSQDEFKQIIDKLNSVN